METEEEEIKKATEEMVDTGLEVVSIVDCYPQPKIVEGDDDDEEEDVNLHSSRTSSSSSSSSFEMLELDEQSPTITTTSTTTSPPSTFGHLIQRREFQQSLSAQQNQQPFQ